MQQKEKMNSLTRKNKEGRKHKSQEQDDDNEKVQKVNNKAERLTTVKNCSLCRPTYLLQGKSKILVVYSTSTVLLRVGLYNVVLRRTFRRLLHISLFAILNVCLSGVILQ